jgi:hypothetical protein
MAVKIPEGSPIARIYIYRAEGERTIEQEGQMCDPTWEEIHKNKNLTEVRDALSTLNPERVRLGNITINLHGDSDKRLKMVDDLRGFDNENLSKISPKIESMLQTTSIYNTKGEKPDYGNDSQAMLAADLIQNNRLSVETLIKLQNEDEGIKTIKENLVGTQMHITHTY